MRLANDIRTEVAAIDDLPARADPPIVRELHRTDAVTSVAVAGDLAAVALERYAEEQRDRLAALPGVARVALSGFGERQFRITVPRAVLSRHGLTAADLAAIVGAQSVDLPAGSLETPGRDLRLRFADERRSVADLAALTVLATPEGGTLRLGDIAEIVETCSPEEERARLDGQRAAFLEVHKALDVVTALVEAETAALATSLIEAFWVLPHHLGHGLKAAEHPPSRLRRGFDRGFEAVRERGVGRAADLAIAWRFPVAGLVLALMIVSVGAVRGGLLQREAIPAIDGDVLQARILMPQGTPLARTEAVADHVIAALMRTDAALAPDQPGREALVRSVQTRFDLNATAGEGGPHVATVSADLLGAETRATTLDAITARWQAGIGAVPGVAEIVLTEPGIGPQGIAIEIRLVHDDFDRLRAAGDALLAEVAAFRGVYNATHDLRPGPPELRLRLKEGAAALGLTAADVAGQVRAAFLGTIIADVQEGDIAHEIELEQAPADRDGRDELTDFTVTLPDGSAVPLTMAADLDESRGWARITHVDGRRTLTVQADVDTSIAKADAIVTALREGVLPGLVADSPGLGVEIGGQSANSAETVGSILRGFLIALVGVYLILSLQFRNYVEPVIVMPTIPLAFIGVIWGHVAMGYNLSMPSILGAAPLAGIVVNNAILLLQVINVRAAEGMDRARAAGQASRDRFGPILISVSTTVMGMAPLLAEIRTQAQTLKPLVISVVFGLIAATALVLIVLPAFFAILADLTPGTGPRPARAQADPGADPASQPTPAPGPTTQGGGCRA